MAYVSQELKAKLAPGIKSVLKKYKLKGSISVRNHSTLCVNIKSGALDFIKNYNDAVGSERCQARGATKYIDVNTYHIDKMFTGKPQKALEELKRAMSVGNHDRSDIMTDYFDVGWYIDINIGRWDRSYIVE